MKRAVIKIGGRQYLVREGDTIKTQLPRGASGEIEMKEILLFEDGDTLKIGRPYVEGALVRATITGQKRGRKLRILRYRPKTRYRRRVGFRPLITELKIEKITAPNAQ